jgi:hypothetical protein
VEEILYRPFLFLFDRTAARAYSVLVGEGNRLYVGGWGMSLRVALALGYRGKVDAVTYLVPAMNLFGDHAAHVWCTKSKKNLNWKRDNWN